MKQLYNDSNRKVGGAFPWEGEYYAQPAMGMRMEEPYMLPPRGGEPTAEQKKRIEEERARFELERQNMEIMAEEMALKNRKVGGRKTRAPSARNAIVKKVMREHGLSLPQASKYVKENGLY